MTTQATTPTTTPAGGTTPTPPGSTFLTGKSAGEAPKTTGATTTTDKAHTPKDGQPAAADTGTKDATKDGKAGEPAADPAKATKDADAKLDIKLPEGVAADPELLGALQDVAKESGMKGEAAQKLADAYVKVQQRQQEQAAAAWEQTKKEWEQQLVSDKDIGGPKLKESQAFADKALARFGSPELTSFFESTGLGAHPLLAKFVVAVGRSLSEDTVSGTTGGAPSSTGEDPFLALYNKPTKES